MAFWAAMAPALVSAAANLGGGMMSAAGQAGINAATVQATQIANAQQLAAQQAQHAQNTAFQEDSQAHSMLSQHEAQIFNSREAALARDWSNDQAAANRNFQEYMAGTAYRRAMIDMKAAGLNPILAYQQGGAPMASGATATGPAASSSGISAGTSSSSGGVKLDVAKLMDPNSELGRALGNAVSSAVDTYKTVQGVKNMEAQERLTDADLQKRGQDTELTIQQQYKTAQETRNLDIENIILRANAITAAQNARTATADAEASERYGGKYAPNTWERILRSIQDSLERGVGRGDIKLPDASFPFKK